MLAGQRASYTFSASPAGSSVFGASVSFACSGLPALTSCQFSPSSISEGASATLVNLAISTTGPNLGNDASSQIANRVLPAAPRKLELGSPLEEAISRWRGFWSLGSLGSMGSLDQGGKEKALRECMCSL